MVTIPHCQRLQLQPQLFLKADISPYCFSKIPSRCENIVLFWYVNLVYKIKHQFQNCVTIKLADIEALL